MGDRTQGPEREDPSVTTTVRPLLETYTFEYIEGDKECGPGWVTRWGTKIEEVRSTFYQDVDMYTYRQIGDGSLDGIPVRREREGE